MEKIKDQSYWDSLDNSINNLKNWHKAYKEGKLSTSTITPERWQYMQDVVEREVKQDILNNKIQKVRNV